jgi:hypothetical protein
MNINTLGDYDIVVNEEADTGFGFSAPYLSQPLRRVAFPAPVIERHNGFHTTNHRRDVWKHICSKIQMAMQFGITLCI